MKHVFLLLIFALSVLTAQAQGWGVVKETERMMSFGARPAFRIEFSNTDQDLVLDQWKTFVKKNFSGKLKKDKRSGEWTALEVKSGLLGNEPFNIYSTVEKQGDSGTALTAWFDLGSSFLNRRSDPGHTDDVAGALRTFYYDVRRAALGAEVKNEEKRTTELESQLKKLQRDNELLRKNIEAYKEKIKKAEADLLQNEKNQETTAVQIEKQRAAVEEARRRVDNVENERN